MNTLSYIQEKINSAKELDFGIIFNNCIELFKKSWIHGFLLQLFVLILMLPFIIIFYIPFIALIISESQRGTIDPDIYENFIAGFSVIYLILFFIGIMVLSAVGVCLYAAFYRILKELDHGKTVKTNDFFYFLKGSY